MELALRAVVAAIGALVLRGYLYPLRWRRRTISGALLAFTGAALLLPLATYGVGGLLAVAAALLMVAIPYRRLAERYMSVQAKAGGRAIARRWHGELREDARTGLWEVVARVDGCRRWAGNVLIHEGSLDPSLRRRETRYMMAFVSELDEPPRFTCSLMLGWDTPRYFAREWRVTHVVRAEYLSADAGELGIENRSGRPTGGDVRRLRECFRELADLPPDATIVVSDAGAFSAFLDDDLRALLAAAARRSYPYELNITPSSVNIYTTYCAPAVQLAHVALLEAIVGRMQERPGGAAA